MCDSPTPAGCSYRAGAGGGGSRNNPESSWGGVTTRPPSWCRSGSTGSMGNRAGSSMGLQGLSVTGASGGGATGLSGFSPVLLSVCPAGGRAADSSGAGGRGVHSATQSPCGKGPATGPDRAPPGGMGKQTTPVGCGKGSTSKVRAFCLASAFPHSRHGKNERKPEDRKRASLF